MHRISMRKEVCSLETDLVRELGEEPSVDAVVGDGVSGHAIVQQGHIHHFGGG